MVVAELVVLWLEIDCNCANSEELAIQVASGGSLKLEVKLVKQFAHFQVGIGAAVDLDLGEELRFGRLPFELELRA